MLYYLMLLQYSSIYVLALRFFSEVRKQEKTIQDISFRSFCLTIKQYIFFLQKDEKDIYFFYFYFTLCPTHSRVGRKKPSDKTSRFLFSTAFWSHCRLRDGSQRRALPWHQSEKMEILNPQPVAFTVTRLCSYATTGLE